MNEDQDELRQAPPRPDEAEGAQPTGHDGVGAVLARLDDLESLPVAEHVALFERAHEDLRAALTEARQTA